MHTAEAAGLHAGQQLDLDGQGAVPFTRTPPPAKPLPPRPDHEAAIVEEAQPGFGVPWLGTGLFVGATAAGFALSAQQGWLLGQIAALALGLSTLHGLWRGGLRKLIMLPVSVGLLAFIVSHPGFADPFVNSVLGQPSVIGSALTVGLVGLLAWVIAGRLAKWVRDRCVRRRPMLLAADRFLGLSIGLAEGALTLLALCWATVLLEPQARVVRDHPNVSLDSIEHRVAAGVVQIAEEINASPLEAIANESNPLEEIPAVRDALYNLGDRTELRFEAMSPAARRRVMDRLRRSQPELFDALMDRMEAGHRVRDQVYQSLPPPAAVDR